MAGLDSDRDGRAFAAMDLDGDGDLDLIVKNRNTPQLVLLRNDSSDQNQSIVFKLVGHRSNRDAVGAKIRLVTDAGERTKFVRLGSGFLSQTSRKVFFGLGPSTEAQAAIVTWPSGTEERFEHLPADHEILLEEGRGQFEASGFRPASQHTPTALQYAEVESNPAEADSEGSWLIEPVPLPLLASTDLEGRRTELGAWLGHPVLVNFWATWCAPCQTELQQWTEAYERIRQAGAEVVAVSVDEPGSESLVRQFVANKQLPFPVLLPEPSSVHSYKIFHRNLLRRPRDLQIPTTYLVSPQGEVVKVYRGATHPDKLLVDLQAIPESAEARWKAALPYPGRQARPRPARDYVSLAFSFMNAGLAEAGRLYLPRATSGLREHVRRNPTNKMVHLYLGVALLSAGEPGEARDVLKSAVALDPMFVDAYFNLGVAYGELGQVDDAIAAFEKAVQVDPGFADAYFNLALIYRSRGQLQKAVTSLEAMAQLAPDSPEPFAELGVVHAERGALEEAIASFQRARELEPQNAETVRNLGVLYYQAGRLALATETLEQAHRLAPSSADTALSLAVAYAAMGRLTEARAVLETLLQTNPNEGRAQRLLQEIDRLR